ncbi:MAG: hypothetical protein KGY53_09740 [Wenzhouxiangellaceae bacterium]|nr:hypothetical protein [Wenzhouxiangellaceae bacterium]
MHDEHDPKRASVEMFRPQRGLVSGGLLLTAAALACGLSGPVSAQQQQPPGVCMLLGTLGVDTGNCEPQPDTVLGVEVAVPERLKDGDEFTTSLPQLIRQGGILFNANWTAQEGGGRPGLTGTGAPLADSGSPLEFPRNWDSAFD